MKTKQKKRDTKKFKKSIKTKKVNKPNGSILQTQSQRFLKLFGNPNIEKFINLTKPSSSEETLKRFEEGEYEFLKILYSLRNPNIFNELCKLHESHPNTYKSIIEIFLFLPYQKFGNKTKSWFPFFYDTISALPYKNKSNNHKLLPLYRAMTESEFIYSREDGVQTPSWSSDLNVISTFINNNLLTMNDRVVLVQSIYDENDICFIPSNLTNTEKEVWVRKGSKSFRTFVVGVYDKSDYLSKYNKNKLTDEKLLKLKQIMSGSNGFGTEESDSIKRELITSKTDDIINKLANVDLPKLGRKISKDKKLIHCPNILDQLNNGIEKSLSYYQNFSYGITPIAA